MSLTNPEHNIIQGMARAMFVTAWADYQEQVLGIGLHGQIMDQAPETPDYVLYGAYYWAGLLSAANGGRSLWELCRRASFADRESTAFPDKEYLEEFGHYMAMQMMGHGASWFDNHEKFEVEIPFREWTYYDLDDEEYPIL